MIKQISLEKRIWAFIKINLLFQDLETSMVLSAPAQSDAVLGSTKKDLASAYASWRFMVIFFCSLMAAIFSTLRIARITFPFLPITLPISSFGMETVNSTIPLVSDSSTTTLSDASTIEVMI